LPGACRDHRPDHIAGLKSLDSFSAFGLGAREAESIDVTLLPAAMPFRQDEQWMDPLNIHLLRSPLSHAGGVDPMRFCETPTYSIEFGETS